MTCSVFEAPRRAAPTQRTAVRHPLSVPLCYRSAGQEPWSAGETVNLSNSGILFYSQHPLEIDETVEIILQASGLQVLPFSTHRARVVRRVLNNWPETRPLLAAKFCN
jgi:hypothetical protein